MGIKPVDVEWMQQALRLAEEAAKQGEVPIGAILVQDNTLVASAYNQPISLNDPTAHAEILALRRAAAVLGNYRLVDTTLYVTLEPCMMCMGALIHARVQRVVFGTYNSKAGIVLYHNHKVLYQGGVLESHSAQILKTFFLDRRHKASVELPGLPSSI